MLLIHGPHFENQGSGQSDGSVSIRRLQNRASMRGVGHLASKERGSLGPSRLGNSGRGDDHPISVHTAPLLLYKMKAFISCLKKKCFKNQQESGRRGQRLAPYP